MSKAGSAARRWNAGIVALTALVATCALLPAGAAGARRDASGFFVTCSQALRNHDDPIAHAGYPGTSHQHDFYGSRAVSATSTAKRMRRVRTSCGEPGDTASYWHPTLLVAGRPITGHVNAYYDRGGPATVRPYPRELKLLAGEPMAEHVQPASRIGFECVRPQRDGSLRPLSRPTPAVPRCTGHGQLAGRVVFPSCWNGRELDSADHRSHMAHARHGRCPSTHPIALPRLVLVVTWPVRPDPHLVTLSSGTLASWHADFWNTWNVVRLRRLVRHCVDEQRDCRRIGAVRR